MGEIQQLPWDHMTLNVYKQCVRGSFLDKARCLAEGARKPYVDANGSEPRA